MNLLVFFLKAHKLHPYPYRIPTPTLTVLGEALGGAHSQNYKGPTAAELRRPLILRMPSPKGLLFRAYSPQLLNILNLKSSSSRQKTFFSMHKVHSY